ncbi:hypothetical protein VTJ04DRAFT_9405 [Mycothermus thermophilus]|uniref:uncharacterized protein n=1 Tax=Humicola insolens TaxID=85995 RepID=UPI00374323AC
MEQLPRTDLPLRAAEQNQTVDLQQQSPQTPSSPVMTPCLSRSSTASSHRSRKSNLSLDLSNLPPVYKPTPPCNTLLFTNLQTRDVFAPDNLQQIRELIERTARIYSFSPLKSFARIVVAFYSTEDAIAVRGIWDGENILGNHCRVYFGQPTVIGAQPNNQLALPDAGKLFFISPPPSPPAGWQQKMEDAPNKMVHAEDLAEALAKLRQEQDPNGPDASGASPISPAASTTAPRRSRSSTLVFQPAKENGASPDLPCVIIDDMTDEPEDVSPIPAAIPPKILHTARPPIELMHDA